MGAVLEVQDSRLIDRFGGCAVRRREVLDIDATNPSAMILGDLGWEPDADGLTITIPAAKGRRHPTPTAARAPLGLPMSRVQPGSNESDGPSGS